MSDINWEYIIDTIKAEKCILILGPEVPVNDQGVPLHSALEDYLQINDNDDILYFNADEFFLFRDETAKFPTYWNIQKFYEQTAPSELYHKLAQIPFHLIISISPDLLLRRVFEQFQIAHQFDYYRKYENPKSLTKPSKEKPLLYNLFGSVEDDGSMIFTYDDMFEFIFASVGKYELPNELKNELKAAKNFILLGFKFEKWYVKLILRLFKLHSGKFLRYASKSLSELKPETKELYESHFRINFVDNNLQEFTDKLFSICQTENILRELGTAENLTLAERAKNKISNGDVEDGIEMLSEFLENIEEDELLNDLTLISSSHRRLKRRMKNKTISEDDAETRLNQILNSLLELADEIKEIEENM